MLCVEKRLKLLIFALVIIFEFFGFEVEEILDGAVHVLEPERHGKIIVDGTRAKLEDANLIGRRFRIVGETLLVADPLDPKVFRGGRARKAGKMKPNLEGEEMWPPNAHGWGEGRRQARRGDA